MQTWDLAHVRVAALAASSAGGCWVTGQLDESRGTASHPFRRSYLWHADVGGSLRPVVRPHLCGEYVYECPEGRVVLVSGTLSESFDAGLLTDPNTVIVDSDPGCEPGGVDAAGAQTRGWQLKHPWVLRCHPYGPPRDPTFVRRHSRAADAQIRVTEAVGGSETGTGHHGFACRGGVALYGLWVSDGGACQLVVVRFDSTAGKTAAPTYFVDDRLRHYHGQRTRDLLRWYPTSAGLLLKSWDSERAWLYGWDGRPFDRPGLFDKSVPAGTLARWDVYDDLLVCGGAVDLVTRQAGCKAVRFRVRSHPKDQDKVTHVAVGRDGATVWFVRSGVLFALDAY